MYVRVHRYTRKVVLKIGFAYEFLKVSFETAHCRHNGHAARGTHAKSMVSRVHWWGSHHYKVANVRVALEHVVTALCSLSLHPCPQAISGHVTIDQSHSAVHQLILAPCHGPGTVLGSGIHCDLVPAALGLTIRWGKQVTSENSQRVDAKALKEGGLSKIRMTRRIKQGGNPGWSRQRAQPVQRPRGRTIAGVLEDQPRGPCSRSRESNGKDGGVGRAGTRHCWGLCSPSSSCWGAGRGGPRRGGVRPDLCLERSPAPGGQL